jgi:tetratricopeptide (TPR) repeat protein
VIPFLIAATTLFDLAGGDPARFDACVKLAKADPAAALAQAQDWATRTPTVPARQCLGLAFVANERWTPAAASFEQAADQAQGQGDARAGGLWSQAGNAQLAAGEPAKARADLDRALGSGLPDVLKGEAWMDRARADVALDDPKTARHDLDQALGLAAGDPFAWLLSATLARRGNDLVRADKDIAQAMRLAGDDPAVMLEQGNIAWARGAADAARSAWTRAAQTDPASAAGKAAALALAEAK